MKDFKELLKEYVSIKSVSTEGIESNEKSENMKKLTEWLTTLVTPYGFETKVYEGYGNPIFFAKRVNSPSAKTILVYGHYDVQPADISDGWEEDPFTLLETEDKYIARGVVDNKGQHLIHICSALKAIENGMMKHNIIFLIEGDEETGGEKLGKFINDYQDILKADTIIISDGEIPYRPTLTGSFRGTFNFSFVLNTANNNLHSGLYGGIAHNPVHIASSIISKLEEFTVKYNEQNRPKLTEQDIDDARFYDKLKANLISESGIANPKNYLESPTLSNAFTNSVEVSGISSGYIGEGYANIIPASITVKVNVRVAAETDPQDFYLKLQEVIKSNTPKYATLKFIDPLMSVEAIRIDIDGEDAKKIASIQKDIYGDRPIIEFCGATLPVVIDFKKILGKDVISIGLANDDCNMHGVNENFDKSLVAKGLDLAYKIYSSDI